MRLLDFTRLRLDAMNETDVRETIARPLISALGYTNGAEAYVRSERTLKYEGTFLGRKSDAKDAPLVGRADYECGVTSLGRWIVEVKSPTKELSEDDAHQAHTYAAHPEVAAELYLLTNGRKFKLYQTSFPNNPVLEWHLADTASRFDVIENILGPDAMRKRALTRAPDVGRPLGRGLPSRIRFVGGTLTYSDYRAPIPAVTEAISNLFQGHRSTIVDGGLIRSDAGLLSANLQLAAYFAPLDQLNRAFGMDRFIFESADEYVSTTSERPTIFQNFATALVPEGTKFTLHGQTIAVPFGFRMAAHTQAVGFAEGSQLRGTFEIRYEMTAFDIKTPNAALLSRVGAMESSGEFDIRFSDASTAIG